MELEQASQHKQFSDRYRNNTGLGKFRILTNRFNEELLDLWNHLSEEHGEINQAFLKEFCHVGDTLSQTYENLKSDLAQGKIQIPQMPSFETVLKDARSKPARNTQTSKNSVAAMANKLFAESTNGSDV